MEFYIRIPLPKAPFTFSHTEQTILLGSCFAENIGKMLEENKFKTDLNPFGTLYNPSSIAEAIRMLLRPERFTGDDLFRHEGIYHSFNHHSRFSSPSETECLANINGRLFSSADTIRKARRMILTFGTAWVYKLKSSGKVVSNCHKLPEKMFDRQLLSVGEIVAEWKGLLLSLWEQNPELKILFTVSPIRHWKDGAHGNQLYTLELGFTDRPDATLTAGMNVEVEIVSADSTAAHGHTVPLRALFNDGQSACVWVMQGDSTVVKRPVTIDGSLDNSRAVVTDGLTGDELIVRAGVNVLQQGEKVKVVEQPSKTNIGGIL